MRSDVGFPGATDEEFTIKQGEIAKEAELEEISPRLIIMITSTDCTGAAVMGGTHPKEEDGISPGVRSALEHRLPGMPFAGKELAMTAFRNRTANTSSLDRDAYAHNNSNSGTSIADISQYDEPPQTQRKPVSTILAQPKPNPTSLFAPPIDATFSSSEMWRARPFADRPSGMVNILVFPLTVHFAVGDIEPLVCTLALYCLPTNTKSSGFKKFRGKISEDFCFPAGGNWKGLLEEKAGKLLARQFGFVGSDGGDDTYGPMDESYGMDTKKMASAHGDDDGDDGGSRRRVKKAMFSYDPVAIPPSAEDPTGRDSLYIVMQVFKVTHKDATSAYVDSKPSSKGKKNKETSSQSKGGLSFGMSKSKDTGDAMSNASSANSHRFKTSTEIKAGKAFDALGTQFLTPLCFGTLPLFPLKTSTAISTDTNTDTNTHSETMQWPNGVTQNMTFFSQPTKPESEDEFVARLIALSEQQTTNVYSSTSSIDAYPPNGSSNSSSAYDTFDASSDNARDFAFASSTSFQSSGSADSSASRWFGKMGRKVKIKSKSKKKSKIPVVKKSVDTRSTSSLSAGCSPIDGNALFFASVLGVDFTSVLLESPSFSKGEDYHNDDGEDDEFLTPRLFVDASGDSAIMVNPETRGSSIKKRSNLIRLPPAVQPSGYSDSCEVREVMYLPPPYHYDADLPLSPRTPVNVLFLYPRLIRYSPDETTQAEQSPRPDHMVKNSSYSVRLQLVEQSMDIDEGTGGMEAIYFPVESIYNPSPGGPPLLQTTFTKIPLSCTLNKGIHTDFADIHLRDEVKIRLPDILDGSHFIQFTLFSIHLVDAPDDDSNGGLVQTQIAETLIPLSSSVRKSTSGARVTTVIPNGSHRIKIADFLFKVETRLASTIHISDPEVATVIRDFPAPESASNVEGRKAIANFSNMLSNASPQAVTNHFFVLVYLHMRIFVTQGRPVFNTSSSRKSSGLILMMNNMRSLFEVLNKVKAKFNASRVAGKRQLNKFLKKFFDSFDNIHLAPQIYKSLQPEVYRLKSSDSSQSIENIWSDTESNEDGIDAQSEKVVNAIEQIILDAGLQVALQQNEAKKMHYDKDERRLKNSHSTRSVPFSRKSLGASKIDRMKAEAELYESEQLVTELFDDDETVVTASTWQSQGQGRLATSANSISFSDTFQRGKVSEFDRKVRDAASVSHTVFSTTPEVPDVRDEDTLSTFQKAKSMAKRVNIVAHLFAPCVAPDLAITQNNTAHDLSRKMSKIIIDRNWKGTDGMNLSTRAFDIKQKEKSIPAEHSSLRNCDPGSDVEEEDFNVGKIQGNLKNDFSPYPYAPFGIRLRASQLAHLIELTYSLPDVLKDMKDLSDQNSLLPPYLYETIFALWMQCCKSKGSVDDSKSFLINMDFLLPVCLKSLVLRCVSQRKAIGVVPLIVFDMKHMEILQYLMGAIAEGLITSGAGNTADFDLALSKALSMNDFLLEFFVGLLAVIHPSQVSWIIFRYLTKLRECEDEDIRIGINDGKDDHSWVTAVQYRLRSSRQLRLRVVEKLSSLPRFIALNFPLKYSSSWQGGAIQSCSWTNQAFESPSSSTNPFLSPYSDGVERLPETHWLAELLSSECFLICSRSCETIVTETISQMKSRGPKTKQSSMRQRVILSEVQIAQHHSTALHAVTVVYELLLRNHAIDTRYQTEDARGRISGMFVHSIIHNSIQSVQWLSKLDPMHKVRTIWLLCVLYISQEAPEVTLREQMRSLFSSEFSIKEGQVHQFIHVLKLCTSTFQGLITGNTLFSKESPTMNTIYPWLTQESFNTISAISILLLEESDMMTHIPFERKKMVRGILDLLLHIISTPQSSVTLLRALGAASHALEKVGATFFLEVVDQNAQDWGRMIFTLMNSTSLSVRTMAVDLTVSLFGGTFKEGGNMDEVALVFVTILPEVVAREIALYSIDGHIQSIDSIEYSLWPMRRAIADIEDTDPIDDDRVDAQLSPFLGQLCRACQAIIDGVLIELRLQGNQCMIVGTRINMMESLSKKNGGKGDTLPLSWTFDADEESLYEASNFFIPETGPMQRLRWLLTLKSLHELKGQWVEAAEASILCAKTIAESIPHVNDVWRPSRFALWNDHQEAPWLSTIGVNKNGLGNRQVMEFAGSFLEQSSLRSLFAASPVESGGQPERPTISALCKIITAVSKAAIDNYDKEGGIDSLAFTRLEQLLKIVMNFVEEHAILNFGNTARQPVRINKAHGAEQNAALRKMSATINELVTKLAERMLLLAEEEGVEETSSWTSKSITDPKNTAIPSMEVNNRLFYVRMLLIGKKPKRFQESTTIPTFLDWETPYVCRVPKLAVLQAKQNATQNSFENAICTAFAEPFLIAMREEGELPYESIEFYTEASAAESDSYDRENKTYLFVTLVHGEGGDISDRLRGNTFLQSKKFCFRNRPLVDSQNVSNFTEVTVAHRFPTTLSRQPTLITTEFISAAHLT